MYRWPNDQSRLPRSNHHLQPQRMYKSQYPTQERQTRSSLSRHST
ncbi:hypothetical protein FFLO_06560 [Filobasidium floriforme]|uniref:Uncharacterized protein n=1 Tax=Filobasidium floriforme TaxID=5210 RepID=A0A8K0JEZ2_9TREE|nr:hypothetical protein FFLO_06560 [Filobasidium floriforme]